MVPILKTPAKLAFVAFALLSGSAECSRAASVQAPPTGKLYQGFYFSGDSDSEHGVTADDAERYEKAVGAGTAWIFFSDFWCEGRAFPAKMCGWIRDLGKVPYVRLMLRSSVEQNRAEKSFTLDAIIAGSFDEDLKKWGADAKRFGSPMLMEWGTECNGEWFAWNGKWNGKARGTEKFLLAWRHIVGLMRAAGADNITWVWHVNSDDVPDAEWNRFENYYPGDAFVDWVAVSAYGPQKPHDKEPVENFRELMDAFYPRINALAPGKPLIVAEFGCTLRHPKISAADWAAAALTDLLGGRWPRISGFCWWNEAWENDDDKKHNTDMVVTHDEALTAVFKARLSAAKDRIQQSPVLGR